jgi:hypothetical protein
LLAQIWTAPLRLLPIADSAPQVASSDLTL